MSLFSSTLSDESYGMILWSEIYGCVRHLNLSYDDLMSMPVHIRKFWIRKNNLDYEERNNRNNDPQGNTMGINAYAKMEQNKIANAQ